MKRFKNAQVGDNVYSRLHGHGEIIYRDKFILKCRFDIKNHKIDSEYLLNGKAFDNDAEPTLFYSDGTNNYITERPKSKKEINWRDYEGKKIEVYDSNTEVWKKRNLIKYIPEKEYPFICEHGNCSDLYSGWAKARIIEEKNPEIDWSNVPEGTQVNCVGDSISYFMTYLHHLEYPFWVYDSSVKKDIAVGYKNCKLAEPVKPEWIKKD